MAEFKLECLDHVAINVSDMEAAVSWYENVLGLQKYKLSKWGEYPIFMLSGKTGIALFPADLDLKKTAINRKSIRIDHFAFNVTNTNFELAKERYKALGLTYTFQDHFYFHSIYTKDLDGHTVELTTLVVDEDTFYQQ
ncbi:MAG: VOC family protein [Maribacter sp.]|uniref:VOC family protein n=1 Tax=Maribacter sp. TaxID=1897614 RepID=UPI003298CC4B